MLPKEPYKKFAVITLYVSVGLAIIYIVFNYLWDALFPFVLAYLFAECFRPIVRYSESHKTFPKRSFVLFVVLIAAFSVIMLIYALARQIVLEIQELSSKLQESLSLISADENYAAEIIEKINSFVPFFDIRERLWEIRTNINEELLSITLAFGEKISGKALSFVGAAIKFFPNFLLATVVIIISTYYFAIDRVKINCFFLSLFPKSFRPALKKAKDVLSETVGKYLRAYGLLFIITFGELLLAFMIIGIEYSFVLALVIAIVDVLPVLGTGTVLIPWGIILIFSGNYATGIGLLITYAVIVVIRQVLEPKIVGKFIGLSPLAALAFMYIGLKVMGILGIFVFPLFAIAVKRLIELKK